jgi:peptidoglycan hydrolase-like protein with peptidoglycan-binding domain
VSAGAVVNGRRRPQARPGFVRSVLALQTAAGNRATAHLLRQPAPQQSAPLLSPEASAAAISDVTKHYDEDSIRIIEGLVGRTPDGVFDADDAQALARLQQTMHLSPTGTADEPFLDAVVRIVGPTAGARSAVIHLVVNRAGLDVSGVLAVVSDPNLVDASLLDTSPGALRTIVLGKPAFTGFRKMVAEIRKQLAVKLHTAKAVAVPAGILTDTAKQQRALRLDEKLVTDKRSIRLLQGTVGSTVSGSWDVDLVRHIAARQQSLGLTPTGMLGESTLEPIVTDLINRGYSDAALRLIVDYYRLDTSHALNILSDANPPKPNVDAETLGVLPGTGVPQVVQLYPLGLSQSFAGLVHTAAHELGHVDQMIHGIASLNVREFLSEGIEIESKGMPVEPIESEADLTAMMNNQLATSPGFLDDAGRMLSFWVKMTSAEKATYHQRFKELRQIIVARVTTEGTPGQQAKLAPFLQRLQTADAGVP